MQIDINPFTEHGWAFIVESLQNLCEKGHIKMIRLDAFGYVTKKAGTSCFMQVRGGHGFRGWGWLFGEVSGLGVGVGCLGASSCRVYNCVICA